MPKKVKLFRFLKKEEKVDGEKDPEKDVNYHLSGKEKEKIENEITYFLSISNTPEQIYKNLKKDGHPVELFIDFINENYLSDFIHDSFTRGFTIEQIKEELEIWKWPQDKIDLGISSFLRKRNL